jgi:hypothetical protein
MLWCARFDDPIPIPGRKLLRTLRDVAKFLMDLPHATPRERIQPYWLDAIEALVLVAEKNGPTMFARIGVMRALNRHHAPEFNPKGKQPHWGRRKLKRDQ